MLFETQENRRLRDNTETAKTLKSLVLIQGYTRKDQASDHARYVTVLKA